MPVWEGGPEGHDGKRCLDDDVSCHITSNAHQPGAWQTPNTSVSAADVDGSGAGNADHDDDGRH